MSSSCVEVHNNLSKTQSNSRSRSYSRNIGYGNKLHDTNDALHALCKHFLKCTLRNHPSETLNIDRVRLAQMLVCDTRETCTASFHFYVITRQSRDIHDKEHMAQRILILLYYVILCEIKKVKHQFKEVIKQVSLYCHLCPYSMVLRVIT